MVNVSNNSLSKNNKPAQPCFLFNLNYLIDDHVFTNFTALYHIEYANIYSVELCGSVLYCNTRNCIVSCFTDLCFSVLKHIVLCEKFHRIRGAPPQTFPNVKYDAPEEVGGDRKCFDSPIRNKVWSKFFM